MSSSSKACAVCYKSDGRLSACGGCGEVVYCSREHQKLHWKAGHKKECKALQQEAKEAKQGDSVNHHAHARQMLLAQYIVGKYNHFRRVYLNGRIGMNRQPMKRPPTEWQSCWCDEMTHSGSLAKPVILTACFPLKELLSLPETKASEPTPEDQWHKYELACEPFHVAHPDDTKQLSFTLLAQRGVEEDGSNVFGFSMTNVATLSDPIVPAAENGEGIQARNPDAEGKWNLDYSATTGVGLRVHMFQLATPSEEQAEKGHEFLINPIAPYVTHGRMLNPGAKIVVSCNLCESDRMCVLQEKEKQNFVPMKVARAWEAKFESHFQESLATATPPPTLHKFQTQEMPQDDEPVITLVFLIDQWWKFKRLAQMELCAHRAEVHELHTMQVPDQRIPPISDVMVHPLPEKFLQTSAGEDEVKTVRLLQMVKEPHIFRFQRTVKAKTLQSWFAPLVKPPAVELSAEVKKEIEALRKERMRQRQQLLMQRHANEGGLGHGHSHNGVPCTGHGGGNHGHSHGQRQQHSHGQQQQHGHSHNGVPCTGHGGGGHGHSHGQQQQQQAHSHGQQQQQQHGHSHNGVPCTGHGGPTGGHGHSH